MYSGLPEKEEIEKIQLQLRSLRKGIDESEGELSIEDMNQTFSPEDLDTFIHEIEGNLEVALELIQTSEEKRIKIGEPGSSHNVGKRPPLS
ncbi:hypothetical protein VDG1235_4246 [Verrucomicrobiia bacterium DG1235]|nr:hypothetical protein VDG1235_4246 [Verrucomicrobiae bacterium DG1235]